MMKLMFPYKRGDAWGFIPLDEECPYNEMILDIENKCLHVFSKEKYHSNYVDAKMDNVGNVKYQTQNGKPVGIQYERLQGEIHYKYKLTTLDDIMFIINRFVFTSDNHEELINSITKMFDEKEAVGN